MKQNTNNALETLRNTKLKTGQKLNSNLILNVWLEEFHDTTMEEVVASNKYEDSRDFYSAHKVTKEQHDWWEEKMREVLPKILKVSKTFFNRGWWSIYLNTAPSVIVTKSNKHA